MIQWLDKQSKVVEILVVLEFLVQILMHRMQLMVYTQTIDQQEGDNKWLKAILDKVRS